MLIARQAKTRQDKITYINIRKTAQARQSSSLSLSQPLVGCYFSTGPNNLIGLNYLIVTHDWLKWFDCASLSVCRYILVFHDKTITSRRLSYVETLTMHVRSSHDVLSTSAIAKEQTSVKQNENRKVNYLVMLVTLINNYRYLYI